MKPPANLELPFFAYGLFKPGEPAHKIIGKFLESEPVPLKFEHSNIQIRDAIPLLVSDGEWMVEGYILNFTQNESTKAYEAITRFVSVGDKSQYEWNSLIVSDDIKVNALVGHNPSDGSFPFDETNWQAKNDPLFNEGVNEIEKIFHECRTSNFDSRHFDWAAFFKLQMAYLLLWSSIERFCALAYGLYLKPGEKKDYLSWEDAYMDGLDKYLTRSRAIVDIENPEKKIYLNSKKYTESIKYYYKVRSHITHRGKASENDAYIVLSSLEELLAIFKKVLNETLFTSPIPEACAAEAAAIVSKKSTD